MSDKNNFQQLEEQQAQEYSAITKKVKKSVDNSVSTFSFIGNVVDLYFTRMFDVMFKLTESGDPKKEDTPPKQ